VPLARSVELGALLLHRGCGLSCAALVAWRGVLGYYALRVLLCEAASAPSLCLRWVLARGWEDADVLHGAERRYAQYAIGLSAPLVATVVLRCVGAS
jgi:tetrahydromethanopterin S-methyltransferase subunit E